MSKPTIICLCGSTRFYDAFQKANYDLTMQGNIVLTVGFYQHSSTQAHGEGVGCDDEQKKKLDELHKKKINLADEILVLNVGGYIGNSTRSEIEHARKTDTRVRYLEGCEFCGFEGPTHDVCRKGDAERTRYASSRICPYCECDNGDCDDTMHRDDDEHEVECSNCEKTFYAYCCVDITYRMEVVDQ